ncbi:MAG TPA: D-alanyl-D-alanine carboxypeptidase family protein, partial [Steroidobacteraceae bacterium]|nr:D-alanyl-D-alanine carboxypeptidase family protein [Steroidobacteraceae bacterium]
MLNPLELTGRASTHVMALPELGCTVHAGVVEPLRALHEAARADGVELKVVSSFRPFDRQGEIWNAKFLGSRPLH